MGKTGHAVLVAALLVAAVAVVPGGAAAADGVAVSGEQADDGTVTVTVTENDTAVANASVTVEALNDSTYAGEGGYETGENGTVELPAPEQNVSVDVTAATNDTTATTTLDLVAPADDSDELAVGVTQATDGSATVSVTTNGTGVANASVAVAAQDNVTYAGADDYTADENGTVDLPAPEQNVTVDVTAEANDQTASTTATLTVAENDSEGEQAFGARVSSFVHALQAGGNMSGHTVAAFVTENNPGADNPNKGPPADDADEGDDAEADDNDRGNGNNGNGNSDDDETGNNGNGNGNGGGNGNNGNGNGNGNGPP